MEVGANVAAPVKPQWAPIVAQYQQPQHVRAIVQMVTTFVPLAAVFWLMYLSLALPYIVTLLLAFPAAGLLVRTFIIMHDCGHGSYFTSRRANDIVGVITGFLTLTPFAQWRRDHALHHASSGDLDRRGTGDIYTLTMQEYFSRTWLGRVGYRLARTPAFLLTIGPVYFFLHQRWPSRAKDASKDELSSVILTNIAVMGFIAIFVLLLGTKTVLTTYLPAYYLSVFAGIWLFFAQHQFEDAYWAEHEEWDYANAAIRGSSYLKLPRVLQWFTGNIGLHHVHHLGPKIPNYKLKRCHDENPLFHEVTIGAL